MKDNKSISITKGKQAGGQDVLQAAAEVRCCTQILSTVSISDKFLLHKQNFARSQKVSCWEVLHIFFIQLVFVDFEVFYLV